MSQALTLARPYARAAFAIAQDENGLAGWSSALGFAAQVAADPRAASLLLNPRLTHAEAVSLLSVDGAGESFTRFLALLAENRRLTQLPEISGLYEELKAEAATHHTAPSMPLHSRIIFRILLFPRAPVVSCKGWWAGNQHLVVPVEGMVSCLELATP
jgi:hypothetical protein